MSHQATAKKEEKKMNTTVAKAVDAAAKVKDEKKEKKDKVDPVVVEERTLNDSDLGEVKYNIFKVPISGTMKAFKSRKEALKALKDDQKAKKGTMGVEKVLERISKDAGRFAKSLAKTLEKASHIQGNEAVDAAKAVLESLKKFEKKA